jgi:hypothetical protein
MDRNPTAAHSAHDELLLARLYGGDLQGRELERARELVASCEECAAALADFGAIAAATAALPVPPRSRDFALSEVQARRLRRAPARLSPSGVSGLLRGLGPMRVLGASMTAAGIAGILAVGVVSMIAPATSGVDSRVYTDTAAQGESAGPAYGPEMNPTAKSGGAQPGATAAPVAEQSAEPPREADQSPRVDWLAGGSAAPTGAPTAKAVVTNELAGVGDMNGEPIPSPAAGPGSQPLWLVGSGMLAAGGLVLLVLPAIGRRRSRGSAR